MLKMFILSLCKVQCTKHIPLYKPRFQGTQTTQIIYFSQSKVRKRKCQNNFLNEYKLISNFTFTHVSDWTLMLIYISLSPGLLLKLRNTTIHLKTFKQKTVASTKKNILPLLYISRRQVYFCPTSSLPPQSYCNILHDTIICMKCMQKFHQLLSYYTLGKSNDDSQY